MYYKDKSENARKKANLRQEISMYLHRIEMVEKTLELFNIDPKLDNVDPELKELDEFWRLTLDKLKYDLDYRMTEYIHISDDEIYNPEQD